MDRKTLEQNYQNSIAKSAELEQNYRRGVGDLARSVKQATQYNPSAPSTQPTQAAPAGASSRKQSDTMKPEIDALVKQRNDALIKAGAYHRAGMKKEEAEQLGIASRVYTDSVNAETKYKTQKNIEATEDYDPSKNKFKAGTATLAAVQDFGQSFMQGAGVLSHYLGGGEAAYRQAAFNAKNLIDKGISPEEALKTAGVVKTGAAPITDYKTITELKHEKNRASVGAIEGLGLDAVNTVSGMGIPAVASYLDPSHTAGLVMMGVSSLGHKYADAYEKYGNADLAFILGLGAGAATITTEQIGGVYGKLGETAAGKAVAKKLMAEAPGLYSLANSVGGKWLRDALSEGIEEGAEDVINYAIEKTLTGDSDEMDNFGYDILLGALAGGVLGGGNAAMRSITYNRVGKALNASPAAVAQQVQEGMEKGAGTAPAIYAAEVQKNPSNQMVGRLYEANLTYDAESGLSKIQNDITQVSVKEIKAMVSKADALAQAAQRLNVEATPQAVATAITDAQRTQSIKTAEDSVGQTFAAAIDNPANAGEKAYNSALAGVAANQGVAARINNDPVARQAFSQLTGVQFAGNTAQDIAAIEVATQNIAKSGKQAIPQAEYAQRVTAAGEQAAAQFDADMQAQAEQMRQESQDRWLSVAQNTITDVDGKRHIKEITNTDVRGNTEIGYKKAEIPSSKKKAVAEVDNAAKYLGKTIVWYEGALQVNGQYRLSNGFRAPDGTIYVNINSRDPLMVTFGHEMFHDLVADSKYSGMIDTLAENPDYANMVKDMMGAKTRLYERNGIELDQSAAAEEVAADISGDILNSRDMLEYIGARNAEAATGIKGFLNRILKKLKGKPSAQEAYNRLSEAQRALIDGMEGRVQDVTAEANARYSIYESYADDISQWVRDGKPNGMVFVLGNTGPVLQGLGAIESDIYLTSDKLNVIQKNHPEVSDSAIKRIPQILEDPVLILRSKGHGKSGSNSRMVVIGAVKAENGQPLLTILDLRPYEKGFLVDDMQKVNSAYTKKNPENFIRGSEIVYADKNRTVPLLRRIGLTIASRELQQSGSIGRITYNGNGVNISGVPFSDIVPTDNYSMQNSAEDADGKHSLMEDAQYMADIDRAVSEATAKADEELKAAQAEVKNLRQQLADYRQQATSEAKETAAWKDGEAKLIADLYEAQSKEKKARALASYMDEYNAISERYRGEVRATDAEALAQYNEKLSNLRSGFRGEMEKLAIEQGAFKRGEKAARDIYVPTSVNGQKVTRGTRTILEASQTPESMLEEHAKEILAGARGYEVISDKKAQEYAERIINKDGYDKADELFTNAVNGDQVLDKKTLVLGEYLYMEAAKAGDVKNAMRYAADVAAAATRAGQVVQAMRVLKKATPTGKLYYLNRMVDTMNKNIVDNGGEPIQIDEGLARKLLETENIKDPKEQGKAVDETVDEIEQNIADQIPATAWDKWNAWRYLSMLGNIRTQVRNVVGNAAFMPLVATKNLLAAGMEKAFIRNGGRTKSAFLTTTNAGKRLMEFGKKDFDTVVDEIQGGGKYNQSSSIEGKRTIFKSKAIEGWRKLTNKAMDKGDEIFSKHHYARALAGYLYANHLDYDKITRNTPQAQEVLNKARAYAILEAQKATFRDANQFASFINKTKRNLLKKAQTAETKGAKAGWYVGTALAEGIMPFTKTPIDIAVRGVEYSPIGLIKGIKEAAYDVKKGNKTAAEAIDTLSAGLTGTGIFALGYFLQSLGFLAGALGGDKEDKYRKDSGAQGFALHIGDKYYTIDWLAPFSLPLFTGAAVAETVENGDEVSFATLADALSTISEPMLEMSMLQGLNAALSSGKYGAEAAIASFVTTNGFSYLAQANPTILGQIARAVDDTSRNAYYYDPNYKGFVKQVKVFVDKQLAKVPFVSKALTSRIDLWGNKQENTGGSFFGRLAYNMLSPGYYSEESSDPVDIALTKLYEETEDTAVLPSKPSKTVTNNKTDYKMNAKQYEEFCIVEGQTAHKEIQTFINSAEYKKMSDEDRVDVLKHLYKYSTYKAQKNLLGDKYVASSTYSRCVKAEVYAKGGNPVYKYFIKD